RYTGPDPFTAASDGANDTFIDRAQACARIVAAMKASAEYLSCKLDPDPKCPDLVDTAEAKLGGAPACYRYDDGVVSNCEHRIQSYVTCDDFTNKPCAPLRMKVDTSGKACLSSDAGTDAAGDG
ncbi:MAG: hypothetical protein ACXWUG_30825, partial [Polyangiales bacterium]